MTELDWALTGMAVAELLALREQIAATQQKRSKRDYDVRHRSLANTLRAIRRCIRNLSRRSQTDTTLQEDLALAKVQQYNNHTDKRARYQPKNPDKMALGPPTVRKLTVYQKKELRNHKQLIAA